MKTIFQMGLTPNNNSFWLSQKPTGRTADITDLCPKLDTAIETSNKVAAFVKNPNYRQMLGDQAATFDDLKGKADALSDSVANASSVCLGGGSTIGDLTLDNTYYFIGIMSSMDSLMSSAKQGGTAINRTVNAPSSGTSPLVYAGLAAAGLIAVAIALK